MVITYRSILYVVSNGTVHPRTCSFNTNVQASKSFTMLEDNYLVDCTLTNKTPICDSSSRPMQYRTARSEHIDPRLSPKLEHHRLFLQKHLFISAFRRVAGVVRLYGKYAQSFYSMSSPLTVKHNLYRYMLKTSEIIEFLLDICLCFFVFLQYRWCGSSVKVNQQTEEASIQSLGLMRFTFLSLYLASRNTLCCDCHLLCSQA